MAAKAQRKDPNDPDLSMRFPKEPCDLCGRPTQWANRSGYRVCPYCAFDFSGTKVQWTYPLAGSGKGAA